MQVLSGDDTFGNALTAFGSLFDPHNARQTIAEMPGLLQLQAGLLDVSLGLDKTAGWQRLGDADFQTVKKRVEEKTWWHNSSSQIESFKWGLPTQPILDQAVSLRRRLDIQIEQLAQDPSKIVLVVGNSAFTPAGIRLSDTGIQYLDAPQHGDGRVTLDSARLPGVRVFRVDAAHGDLANKRQAFDAYVELLTRGDTSKLEAVPEVAPAARGAAAAPSAAAAVVPSRPSRRMGAGEPPSSQGEVFALPAPVVPSALPPLRIAIRNGNLKFIREPLLIGHYRSLKLTGSEKDMDTLLGRAMLRSLNAGLYPSTVGSHQVFLNTRPGADNPFAVPRPEAVVIVGLGEEGMLQPTQLSAGVRQAALAYAQRVSELRTGGSFDLAATLIGAGGIGIQVGTAAQAIAEGVREANERLWEANERPREADDHMAGSGWPLVGKLQLIELYLDRATEAHDALKALAAAHSQRFDLSPQVEPGLGALPRPRRSSYRGAGYDFISVQQRSEGVGNVIEFTLDTQRARTEVRGVSTQVRLINELVRVGADDRNHDKQIGRSLFNLLVPVEVEPFLSGSSAVLLQLDKASAAYPWELMDTQSRPSKQPNSPESQSADATPWAVRTRVLRKLRTADFRINPRDSKRGDGILVIGEPQCDPKKYPSLPGAADEAQAVADVLMAKPGLKLDALAIVNLAYERPYKVVHIAGHGIYREDGTGGVALSNHTVFGPREFEAMRTVPQLAFINCCYLGKMPEADAKVSALGDRRPLFAATVAEQLIRMGARCVVAAGWAVDDIPAKVFAQRFYRELVEKRPFVEAVGRAREETYERHPDSNTWAAYQCYGEPDWRYSGEADGGNQSAEAPWIASPEDLDLELENLTVQFKFGGSTSREVRPKLSQLETRYGDRWGRAGAIAQRFGEAYSEINQIDDAIRWYSRAIAAEDGGASLRAVEQLGNLRARRSGKLEDKVEARRQITAAIHDLERVEALEPTSERASLVGSAFKRLAMLEATAGRSGPSRKAIAAMRDRYAEAEKLARKNDSDNLHYAMANRMNAELVLNIANPDWRFDSAEVLTLRQLLLKKATEDPEFWSVIGLTEWRIYEALSNRSLAAVVGDILTELVQGKGERYVELGLGPRPGGVHAVGLCRGTWAIEIRARGGAEADWNTRRLCNKVASGGATFA
jgi:tetratricopeptide (TPR) repeat protein